MRPTEIDPRPRILHLLKWLPRGGIETWLTHVFANSVDSPVRHEVLLMQEEIGPYEAKVRASGVPIHVLPMSSGAAWLTALFGFLRRTGPYAVFHAHVDSIVSGPALAVARVAGVRVRIVHNHAARSMGADYQKIAPKLREATGNAIAAAFATRRIGITEMAIEHLAGAAWRNRLDCSILLYGFDYSGNRGAAARADVLRRALSIPHGARVIGHVGRFDPVKNHVFLLEIFAELSAIEPRAVLVLVGRGALQEALEQQATACGIRDKVYFVGGTDDIPAYMALFDAFVFTSFSEGLGIVLLEAQAAGTPILMPDNMPAEAVVIPEGVAELPLSASASVWATRALELVNQPRPAEGERLRRVEASRFGMARCVTELNAVYAEELARHA